MIGRQGVKFRPRGEQVVVDEELPLQVVEGTGDREPSPLCSSTVAQKNSLYIQVTWSVANAARAGRHSGMVICQYWRHTLAPSTSLIRYSSWGVPSCSC